MAARRRRIYKTATAQIPTDAGSLGYLAGIIDGEGTIFAMLRPGNRPRWQVRVTNTDERLMSFLLDVGGTRRLVRVPGEHRSTRNLYSWVLCGSLDVLALLEACRPWMLIKADLAEAAISSLRDRFRVDAIEAMS